MISVFPSYGNVYLGPNFAVHIRVVSLVDFSGIILLSKASILWPFVLVSVNSLETVIQKLAKDYFLFLLLNDKIVSLSMVEWKGKAPYPSPQHFSTVIFRMQLNMNSFQTDMPHTVWKYITELFVLFSYNQFKSCPHNILMGDVYTAIFDLDLSGITGFFGSKPVQIT